MSIALGLSDVLDAAGQPLARLDTLAQHIPQEWVEAAALLADQATIRQRRLPADMVLWLVVGMALLRSEPIPKVARSLYAPTAGGSTRQYQPAIHSNTPQAIDAQDAEDVQDPLPS